MPTNFILVMRNAWEITLIYPNISHTQGGQFPGVVLNLKSKIGLRLSSPRKHWIYDDLVHLFLLPRRIHRGFAWLSWVIINRHQLPTVIKIFLKPITIHAPLHIQNTLRFVPPSPSAACWTGKHVLLICSCTPPIFNLFLGHVLIWVFIPNCLFRPPRSAKVVMPIPRLRVTLEAMQTALHTTLSTTLRGRQRRPQSEHRRLEQRLPNNYFSKATKTLIY